MLTRRDLVSLLPAAAFAADEKHDRHYLYRRINPCAGKYFVECGHCDRELVKLSAYRCALAHLYGGDS